MSLFRYYYDTPIVAGGGGTAFDVAVLATSPDGYWRLGEPSGTDAVDEAGTQNGVYVDSPTLGVTGYASGDTGITLAAGDEVTVANNAAWDMGTGDFSFMAAINLSSWDGSSKWLFGHSGDSEGQEWGLYMQGGIDGNFRLQLNAVTFQLNASTTIAGAGWLLLGVSVDRDSLARLTINGSEEDTISVSAQSGNSLSQGVTLHLGARANGNNMIGSLDEVAVWKGQLISAAQFTTFHAAKDGSGGGGGGGGPGPETQAAEYDAMLLSKNPNAYYTLDDTSASTMLDSSSNSNDGNYSGSPLLRQTGPMEGSFGVEFRSLSVDFAIAPYTSALDPGTGDYALAFWVKWAGGWPTSNEFVIGRNGDGNTGNWEVYRVANFDDLLKGRVGGEDQGNQSNQNTNLNDDAWHLIIINADRSDDYEYYVDNIAEGTTPITADEDINGSLEMSLYIARRANGQHMNGVLSRVAYFPAVLSSGDRGDLWTAAGN